MKLIVILAGFLITFLPIELEKRNVLGNKVEILIPKGFKEMTPEMLDLKYKGQNKPTLVFTDEEGTVNIAFNHLSNVANGTVIESYKNSIKSSFQKSFPNAMWKGDGVKEINGRKVGYIKLVTDAIDQKVYNSLFITHCEGKLLIGTFNCTEKLLSKWEQASEEMIASLKVN
jgi:hypothetical protein